jgi:hypothetical protein
MGLDQYAFINPREEQRTDDQGNSFTVKIAEQDFYWRKHSRLQDFMEELFVAKTGRPATELNCYDMELTMADINKLEGAWHNGYEENVCDGGFFYGHQFQGEQVQVYREEDLEFIYAAREALAEGQKVIYHCWW